MTQLFTQTDKKLIPTLPLYAFEGKIVTVQSESEAKRAVDYLKRCSLLGIDTETRPSFKKGTSYKVALLQISAHDICFLFRLNYMGFPPCLIELLEAPDVRKVGLSLKDDIRQLRQRFADFEPQNCVDLQDLAAQIGIQDMSLAKLYANVFRLRLSKAAQLSNWEADVLTDKQKVYAATDAQTCVQLYERLTELHQSNDFELLHAPEPPARPAADKPAKSPKPKRSTNKIARPKRPARKRKTTSTKTRTPKASTT